MKKVALLVFGQFRTASLILEHNLKEIKKSFGNQTDTIYHIYILTDKEINLLNIIFEYVYKEIGFKLDKNMTISDKFNKLDEIVFVSNIGVSKNPELRYKILKVFYKMLLFLKLNLYSSMFLTFSRHFS